MDDRYPVCDDRHPAYDNGVLRITETTRPAAWSLPVRSMRRPTPPW